MGELGNLTAVRRCGDQQAFSVTGDEAGFRTKHEQCQPNATHRKVQSWILSVIKGKPLFESFIDCGLRSDKVGLS